MQYVIISILKLQKGVMIMLFAGIRLRIKKLIFHIEHGTVIGHTKNRRLVVKFDNGETKIIKDEHEPILDVGVSGIFCYKINRVVGFEIDLDL